MNCSLKHQNRPLKYREGTALAKTDVFHRFCQVQIMLLLMILSMFLTDDR